MNAKAAALLEQARQLTANERRELAIELLEAAADPAVEQAWIEEVRRRVTEVDSGEVEAVPHHAAWQHALADGTNRRADGAARGLLTVIWCDRCSRAINTNDQRDHFHAEQCGCCRKYKRIDSDWGWCRNHDAVYCGRRMFEHDTCSKWVEGSW